MKLPSNTIKIGYRIYNVEEWTAKQMEDAGNAGICDKNKGEICICTSQDDRQIANTFLHEIGHAIYWEWTIYDKDGEERIITTLTNGLTTVWVDNKIWFEWLAELLK
jgi:hypothetical protein